MARSDKMYKNSPRIVRDDESGAAKVSRAEKKASEVNAGTDGIAKEGEPAPEVKEALKESMYDRHITDLEDLVKKMKKERSSMSSDDESGEDVINKIEKNTKE